MWSSALSRRLNVSLSEVVRGKMMAKEMNAHETFTANRWPFTSYMEKKIVAAMETMLRSHASMVMRKRK